MIKLLKKFCSGVKTEENSIFNTHYSLLHDFLKNTDNCLISFHISYKYEYLPGKFIVIDRMSKEEVEDILCGLDGFKCCDKKYYYFGLSDPDDYRDPLQNRFGYVELTEDEFNWLNRDIPSIIHQVVT